MGERFQQFYFDNVYNPLYDATTATLGRYRSLQQRCLRLLGLNGGERVLCLGLGTGNEIAAALQVASGLQIVGVDLSEAAIRRAKARARSLAAPVELHVMDARCLDFEAASFDRVLCVHVLDFVPEVEAVVAEALRVLRPGGRFVLTFPSDKEGLAMGGSMLGDQVRSSLRAGRRGIRLAAEVLLLLPVAFVYLPLMLRQHRRTFTREQASRCFDGRGVTDIKVDEEPVYQDLILAGRKT